MLVLADARSTTPPGPLLQLQASTVMLSGSRHIMQGAFGVVTKNLFNLGAFKLEDVAASTSTKADLEVFDFPLDASSRNGAPMQMQANAHVGGKDAQDVKPNGLVNLAEEKEKRADAASSSSSSPSMQFVGMLHKACQQAFGNHEPLRFEFIEEGGPDHKQCILTIKRPNGPSRSYASEASFKRKSDAKARVAELAVEMGAVDFILTGNKDNSKLSSLLAPIDTKTEDSTALNVEDDETSKEILACCAEWRAGRVQPRWVFFAEHKGSPYTGCALVVELSAHLQRVYSVPPIYDSQAEAKKQCSLLAVKQGVIDFIKFGNGQTAPALAPDELLEQSMAREEEVSAPTKKGREGALLLQSFFDTLPKPFPEPIGDRPASEINAPGMLNNTLQLAKGAKLSIHFYFLNESGLHGCILRLDRPEETRSYMVDPKFAKRPDAKAAVCLLAMFQGVNQYIRDIAASVENKISLEMRKMANEQILPILGSEYAKLRQGMHPTYEYDHDQGAFGSTLILTIPPESGEGEGETRKWTVPAEYRTKQDAKIAVVCKAGGEAITFVRFRGHPPPSDHDPFKPYKRPKEATQMPENGKKVDVKREVGSPPLDSAASPADRLHSKRQTSTSGQVKLGLPGFETKEDDGLRQKGDGVRRPKRIQQGKSRQGPYSSAPSASYGAPQNTYVHPYDIAAAAAAVIDRITGAPAPVHHSQAPYTMHHQPPPPPPVPMPHMHSLQPPPQYPYAAGPYPPAAYSQDARPFPTMPAYPAHPSHHPPNVYPIPTAAPPHPPPPAYAEMHEPYPPPHTAYYPDSHVQHYVNPAPHHPAPAHPATPYGYSQPQPALPHYPDSGSVTPGPPPAQHSPESLPRYSHGSTPPHRSTSFSNPKDRQKRPRSRERTPSETQIMKKQRSESSLPTERSSRSRESPGWNDRRVSPTPPPARSSRANGSSNASAVTALFEYCADERISRPEFSHKVVSENGTEMYKVWVIHGRERLELPTLFHSVNEGKQRLAKQVLQRLKSQSRSMD